MSKAAPAAPKEAAAGAAPAPKSLVSKLKIPGIIVAVIVVEWLAASMYLPSAAPSKAASEDHEDEDADSGHEDEGDDAGGHGHGASKHEKEAAGGHGGHGGHGSGHGEKPAKGPSHGDQEEVDLGEFTVTGYQPVSNSTMFITFHLYGTIKHKHSDDFASRLEENKHRFRENVIVIIRSAEITDLTDAGLGLIKRRILETTNKTLGKPLLQGVVFSDFSFVEQ